MDINTVIDFSLKELTLPEGTIYKKRERVLVIEVPLKSILDGKRLSYSEIKSVIMDDIVDNNLKCIGLRIVSVDVIIMKHTKDTPKQEIFYESYFKQ